MGKWRLINLISTLYKKLGFILILIVILTALVGCDNMQETENGERVYLNLGVSNTYGVETLNPGEGRFIYDKNAVAEIDFSSAEGYNFIGWEGEDRDALSKESDGQYILKMNDDREIKANLELVNFKPIEVNFSGIDPVKYSELGQVTNVPHNLEDVSIKFNNELYQDNELIVEIEKKTSGDVDEVDSNQIEIVDNNINIVVTDWIDRFYSDSDNDSHLEFGKDYILHVDTINENGNIFDVNNKEIDEYLAIDFSVEEPYPAVPENVNLDINNGTIELSWLRSKTNAKIDVKEYVSKYKIYKSTNKEYLKDKSTIEEHGIVPQEKYVDPQKENPINWDDSDVNLEMNDYYYRVIAINDYDDDNEYDNESRLSEIVSTESK